MKKHLPLIAIFLLGASALHAESMNLETAISTAIKNNPGMQAVQAQVEIKGHEKNTALAHMLPTVTGKYDYVRLERAQEAYLPLVPVVSSQAATAYALQGVCAYYPAMPQNDRVMSVEVSQPLFTGGQLYNAYKIAGNEKKVAALSLGQSTRELKLAVINAYYDVLVARKYREVAVSARDTVNSHVKVAQAFYGQGMIPKNDLLIAQVRSAESEQNLIKADNSTKMADSMFNMMLSRDLATQVDIVDLIDRPGVPADLDEATKIACDQREEMKTLRIQMDSAGKAVHIAQAAFGPTVGASITWNNYSYDHPNLDDNHYWQAGVGLEWKLFDGSANYWNLKKAKTQQTQVDYLYQKERDQIGLEVKNAYLMTQEAGARITVASKAIDQAKENLRIEKDRFNLQMATSTDVLDAQTTLTDAERNLISARADYAKDIAELKSAMGAL